MNLPSFAERFLFWIFVRSGRYFFPYVAGYAPGDEVQVMHFGKDPQMLAASARDLEASVKAKMFGKTVTY